MQQIKLIALDLDGTSLNDKSHLPDYTREVLEQAAETGIRLVIASGRAYSSLPEEVLNLKGLAYAITSNGAATYDMKKKERSFAFPMEENKVEALLDLLNEEPETAIEVFWEGNPYASRDFLDHPTELRTGRSPTFRGRARPCLIFWRSSGITERSWTPWI